MKNLILLIAAQILVGLTASADANAISRWEDNIPLNEQLAIHLINEKAAEYTYRDSDTGTVCGGETAQYELADYYTAEDYDGLVTHNLALRFHVTVPVDYCAAQAVKVCETRLAVTDEDDVQMIQWKCE